MHRELLEKIDSWYGEGRHQDIVEAIEAVPQEERCYALTDQYAVALNNTRRYQEAMDILESVREEGQADGAWHYRYGYALYMLDREEEAAACFRQAIACGRDDEDIREMLDYCESAGERRKQKELTIQRRIQERKLPDPLAEPFAGFDFTGFWDDGAYALEEYVGEAPSGQLIREIEEELGYKLPRAYIWLMERHNGGMPTKTCHPAEATTWSDNHIAITGILGIGREKSSSLGGSFGSKFWIEEWEYPGIGVAICNCPSAGHDMVFLDYRHCGPQGEPMVVHVDQERNFEITWVADDFESFIRGLVPEEDFSEEDGREMYQNLHLENVEIPDDFARIAKEDGQWEYEEYEAFYLVIQETQKGMDFGFDLDPFQDEGAGMAELNRALEAGGYEANGYGWEEYLTHYISEKDPGLAAQVNPDSEADTCGLYTNAGLAAYRQMLALVSAAIRELAQ